MNVILNKMMLSCKKATEMIEKKKIVALSLKEEFQLKLHLGMCKSCQTFKRESGFMDDAFQKIHTKDEFFPMKENDILKEKILKLINKH